MNTDGGLACHRHPAKYMASLLALDRPFLRLPRVRRILQIEAKAYIDRMLPELEAAKRGEGALSRKELAEVGRKLCEYHRLPDLCNAPLDRLRDITSAAIMMRCKAYI